MWTLQARLKSARATEQRLIELLGTRTGKLEDVLEAERELARIRGEIEGMQGQSAILVHRVNYATVQVDLNEEYRQVLGSGPVSTGTKIRNAAVEGFTNLEDGAVALVVFVFAVGPVALVLAGHSAGAWVVHLEADQGSRSELAFDFLPKNIEKWLNAFRNWMLVTAIP